MIPADIERFRKMSDEELYAEMAASASPGNYQMAVEELQRRLLEKVEIQVSKLANSSMRIESLTKWLIGLTIALLILTVVQALGVVLK